MQRILLYLIELVWDGKIPLLMWLRRLLTAAAIIAPLILIAAPQMFKDFGELGWGVLTAVLLIRPIADIFPDIRVLRVLLPFRKEAGILAGVLVLCHAVGFFIANQAGVVSGEVWLYFMPPASPLFWGVLGVIVLLPVLATSNTASMRFLKTAWKKVQLLVYPAYALGAVHIALISKEMGAVVLLALVIICWLLARFSVTIPVPRPSIADRAQHS